jgi:hypothetical protein
MRDVVKLLRGFESINEYFNREKVIEGLVGLVQEADVYIPSSGSKQGCTSKTGSHIWNERLFSGILNCSGNLECCLRTRRSLECYVTTSIKPTISMILVSSSRFTSLQLTISTGMTHIYSRL